MRTLMHRAFANLVATGTGLSSTSHIRKAVHSADQFVASRAPRYKWVDMKLSYRTYQTLKSEGMVA